MKLAILICAYNPLPKKLAATLESINSQKIKGEIFLVNDGSTNIQEIKKIADKYQVENLINIEKNVGLTKALNIGIDAIESKKQYQYIARMDVGDINKPNRFEIQVNYLEQNKDIDGVGSWFELHDELTHDFLCLIKGPTTSQETSNSLHVNSFICHPSWLFKADVFFKIRYNEKYKTAQDYDFLVRAIKRNFKILAIDKSLISCEDTKNGISRAKRKNQLISRLKIQCGYFNALKTASWIGIARTMALLIVPRKLVLELKKRQKI